MKVIGLTSAGIVCAALGMGSIPSAASAAIYNFKYSGTVSSVDIIHYDDSTYPPATVKVGDKFSGIFSLDSATFNSNGSPDAEIELSSISFNLPGQNYTEDFVGPSGVAYTTFPEGSTSIIGGRPDYGRQMRIDVSTGPGGVFNPKNLYGKSGDFFYADYLPSGFIINGSTTIAAISSVPEPATWGMMIVGLGMAGALARRRRQRVSTRLSYAL